MVDLRRASKAMLSLRSFLGSNARRAIRTSSRSIGASNLRTIASQAKQLARAKMAMRGAVAGGVVLGAAYAAHCAGGVEFINSADTIVLDAIEGLVRANPGLCRLDGYPGVKVILRSDWNSPENAHKVAIISGGGAGHEPAHAGFVGEGMLTAAVSGDIFASPSTYAVLAAIKAVAYPGGEAQKQAKGSPGVLLVVKNYTGDRVNFTIALEQARAEGIPVEMVVVGDDCALGRSKGVTGRRGIAGTCFVHKIAGAAAEAGLSLKEVTAEARNAASSVASVGVSASVCHIPGRKESTRIKKGHMEMGLGIHGEPGAAAITGKKVKHLVDDMLNIITDTDEDRSYMNLKYGDKVALLVNNLGSTIPMEISIATSDTIKKLESMGVIVERVVTGPLMTSMDMAGFSVSLLKLPSDSFACKKMLMRLDAGTNAPGWPRGGGDMRSRISHIVECPKEEKKEFHRPAQLTSTGKKADAIIHAISAALTEAEDALTAWDLKVGDGDCGVTFRRGALSLLYDISGYPLNNVPDTLEAITQTIAKSTGGTSGVMYRIFLLSLCSTMRTQEQANVPIDSTGAIAESFSRAVNAVSTSGGATAGDRTMLDALIPAAMSLEKSAEAGVPLMQALEAAVVAAEVGAEATKDMDARAGRSNYVPKEVLRSNPDPGAKAAAIWMRAAYDKIKDM
eukprot:CAMPEP_0197532344 /NCGR_PEP_ID=MMETSP1318-20131121/39363_1 /TAXON_ID=552666 /ORGANISM="Partenskyella glossopodia, Strain RCC365" /LENGTH=678 /DNA_ID=CAMNT_0043088881 /DNA_START=52 /DNA_END=2088 /DNA_ORIENTATION=+